MNTASMRRNHLRHTTFPSADTPWNCSTCVAMTSLTPQTARADREAMGRWSRKEGAFVQPHGGSGLATLLHADLPENLRAFFPDPAGKDSYPIVTGNDILNRPETG